MQHISMGKMFCSRMNPRVRCVVFRFCRIPEYLMRKKHGVSNEDLTWTPLLQWTPSFSGWNPTIFPTNPLIHWSQTFHWSRGDYFGETALVQKAPRNATVVAIGDVRLRVLSHDQFEEFDLHRKLQLEVRHANMKTGAIGVGVLSGWWMIDGWMN